MSKVHRRHDQEHIDTGQSPVVDVDATLVTAHPDKDDATTR
jgi:hypothetical protein